MYSLKNSLTPKEILYVASLLFGLFFGAGNLIFPVHLGQLAGANFWPAITGFIITGVGIPVLGVAAIGITKSNGLQSLANKVHPIYSVFFTALLYLTIGPFFAVPRCATVPFSISAARLFGENIPPLALPIFTVFFFSLVLFFSLKPQGILTWIGKILNPIFLSLLALLIIAALISPMSDSITTIAPAADYTDSAAVRGFLEGYNTMDAIAALAFGIIVVNSIKGLGINDPAAIAKSTVKAGVFSGIMMAAIYIAITLIGTMSRGQFETSANGGIALAQISAYYFGPSGAYVLAGTAFFACLKTAIGLITSCSATFEEMFPKGPRYNHWAIIFSVISLLIANIGLTSIISLSIPVLMFLYPLTITLILLALIGNFFSHSQTVYLSVTAFTIFAAVFDLIATLPAGLAELVGAKSLTAIATAHLPFFSVGLGWTVPAIIGLATGIIIHLCRNNIPAKR